MFLQTVILIVMNLKTMNGKWINAHNRPANWIIINKCRCMYNLNIKTAYINV